MNEFKCLNCGCTKGRWHDGLLGYEAMICTSCEAVHDHVGVWVNEKLITEVGDKQ